MFHYSFCGDIQVSNCPYIGVASLPNGCPKYCATMISDEVFVELYIAPLLPLDWHIRLNLADTPNDCPRFHVESSLRFQCDDEALND
jgi:hypothetical protein